MEDARAFARRRAETLRQMHHAADAMEQARDAGDRLGVARADTAFHRPSPITARTSTWSPPDRLMSGRAAAQRTPNLMAADRIRDRSLGEHRAVIAAFAKGDLGNAETILEQHIWRMREDFHAARRRAGWERRA